MNKEISETKVFLVSIREERGLVGEGKELSKQRKQ